MTDRIFIVSSHDTEAQAVRAALASGHWSPRCVDVTEATAMLGIDVPSAMILLAGDDLSETHALLEQAQQIDDQLPVVVVLLKGSHVEAAVDLMKRGAYDVLVWPIEPVRFTRVLEHAIHLYHLTKRVFVLESQVGGWRGKFENLIGHGPKMQEIFGLIRTVARSQATVLITGESGTGKELVARAVHHQSHRAAHPFMDLNCGAIPRELLESELFGHERGAFTGAERRYIGCCERANQGTLFMDEICEMEPALQVKILRLLQERSFTRVGGSEKITVDLRFVAATNREIQTEVQAGRFREDLFYRLNVVPIHLPPLRDRAEDIPLLAQAFLERFAQKLERPFIDIEPETMEYLTAYQWPGNVRELENAIERMVVLNNDTRLKTKFLPPNILKTPRKNQFSAAHLLATPAAAKTQSIIPLDLVEKYAIESALEKCVGNVSEAAKRLKIGQATLYRKIRQYGLRN